MEHAKQNNYDFVPYLKSSFLFSQTILELNIEMNCLNANTFFPSGFCASNETFNWIFPPVAHCIKELIHLLNLSTH